MIGRPRRFSVANMRYRVVLQKHVDSLDDAGQSIATWTTVYQSEPADYAAVSGGQVFRGSQVNEGINAVFTVRYRDEYAPQHRILYNGQAFGIVFVQPIEGRDRYLDCHCKVVE
jgi:SPP1 family predicted phage head-tail adaptor